MFRFPALLLVLVTLGCDGGTTGTVTPTNPATYDDKAPVKNTRLENMQQGGQGGRGADAGRGR